MAAEATPSNNSSSSSPPPGGFDCNICLELAQDPVVTLCGHLFCWPCLYRWLHGHATCQDCPVCKALVEEDKVIPLYGRGNPRPVDPRKKPPPQSGHDVPHRPQGQRPETARPPDHQNTFNQHQQQAHPGFNFFPGAPVTAARFGNLTFSVGFGLFPSLFQVHGFADPIGYAAGPFGFPMGVHDAARTYAAPPPAPDQQQETKLFRLFLFLGFLVLSFFLFTSG